MAASVSTMNFLHRAVWRARLRVRVACPASHIAAGFGGTLIGLQLLGRLPRNYFRHLKLLLTTLAILMIIRVSDQASLFLPSEFCAEPWHRCFRQLVKSDRRCQAPCRETTDIKLNSQGLTRLLAEFNDTESIM